MAQQLQKLSLRHFQIAHLLAQGKTQAETARKLNISPASIQSCLQTPEFLEVLETLRQEYAEKIAERAIVPFAEMQKTINEEALGALSRVVDLSHQADKDSVKLKANLELLNRASNVPKSAEITSQDANRELFSANVVQLVLQTAMQVGDTTVIKSAERALKQIPELDAPNIVKEDSENVIDVDATDDSPFRMKTIDELLSNSTHGDDYSD